MGNPRKRKYAVQLGMLAAKSAKAVEDALADGVVTKEEVAKIEKVMKEEKESTATIKAVKKAVADGVVTKKEVIKIKEAKKAPAVPAKSAPKDRTYSRPTPVRKKKTSKKSG